MTNASSAGRSGPVIRLAYLSAGVVWLVVSLLPRGATLIYLWPWPLVLAASLLVPPGVLAWRLARGEAMPRLGGLADSAALALLIALVAGALLSPFRAASLGLLMLPLAALCLIYEMQNWRSDDPDAERLVVRSLSWLLVLFTVESLGLWFVLIAWPNGGDHLWQARNPHPLGHSNYTAGGILLLLPFGLARLAETGARPRLFWGTAVAAAFFCLFTAGSRAALLGVAAGGATGGLLLVRCGFWTWRRALLLVTLCGVGATLFAVVNPRVRELLRPGPGGIPDDSTIQRAAMRDAGRLMVAERPVFGWGPGTTPLVYPRFRRELSGGVDTALQLHNAPLQVAVDAGLAGLAAMIFLLGAGARSCWCGCAQTAEAGRLPAAAVAGVAIVTYGVFAVYDFELDVPFFALVGAACLALLFSRPPAASTLPRWPALLVVLAALGLAAVPRIPELHGHFLLARAADALENQDPDGFDALAVRASAADSNDTAALNALALQFGERAHQAQDPATRVRLTHAAEGCFEQSLARNPDQEICETNLAWLLLPGEPARAEPHFLQAAALVPDKEGLGLGLAQARVALGRREAAVAALATECLADPRFLVSPLWRDAPFVELHARVLTAVADRAGSLASSASLASWQRAELVYLARVASWLNGRIPPAAVIPAALSPEQRAFFSSARPAQLLIQMAAATPEDIIPLRIQRPGYGVLMRNLDAPMPSDFYWSKHYRFIIVSGGFLLPERMHLPGPILLTEFLATNVPDRP